MLQLCILGTHQCHHPSIEKKQKPKQNRQKKQHHCANGCDPESCKSSEEGESHLENSKTQCGFALRYLSPYIKSCCALEAAAGSWPWELTAASSLGPSSSSEALLLECPCMLTVLPQERCLGLQSRSLGAGLPWPLLCPLPQEDVRLGTHLGKLERPSVCSPQLPSASGPRSLACIKPHKSQGCCQFPLVRKGQMEARGTTFMFLSRSGRALHSGPEACAGPGWALASDVPVWAAQALRLVL